LGHDEREDEQDAKDVEDNDDASVILHFSFYRFLYPKNQQKPTKTRKPGNLET
jgi:hypothetical protein